MSFWCFAQMPYTYHHINFSLLYAVTFGIHSHYCFGEVAGCSRGRHMRAVCNCTFVGLDKRFCGVTEAGRLYLKTLFLLPPEDTVFP